MAVYKFDDLSIYKIGVAISNQLEKRYIKKSTYNKLVYEYMELENRVSKLETILRLNDYQTEDDVKGIVTNAILEVIDEIPSKTSDLENDSDYMTPEDVRELVEEVMTEEVVSALNDSY